MKLFIYFLITFFSFSTTISAQTETDCNEDTVRHYFEVSLTMSEYEILKKITQNKCVIPEIEICTCTSLSWSDTLQKSNNSKIFRPNQNQQPPLQSIQDVYEYKNGQMIPVYNSQLFWQRSVEVMKRLGF